VTLRLDESCPASFLPNRDKPARTRTNTLVTSGTVRDAWVKKMGTKGEVWIKIFDCHRLSNRAGPCATNRGQAMVEFTLVFILLIIIAWIPADFGLAFYTSQIAQNAVREGARIAAADPTLTATNTTCGPPLSSCFGFGNIFNETAVRLPSAMLGPSSQITVSYPAAGSTTCNQLVSVSVQGQYPFFFYKVLRFVGIDVTIPTIQRSSTMRWEHIC
jgi:Flp pilus assembly protein TadG